MANPYSLSTFALPLETGNAEQVIAFRENEKISRTDFMKRVDDWQYFFAQMPGNKYVLYLEDAAELAAALFGAWHVEKIIVLPGDRLPSTLKHLAAMTDGTVGEMPLAFPIPGRGTANGTFSRIALDIEKPALIIFTSGSTGEPSAIEKKLAQLQSEVVALEASFGNELGNCMVYGTVSHQHIYGLLFRVLWPLMSGRAFYSQRLEYPEQIARQLSAHHSVLIASPAHLKRLPENLDWQAMKTRLRAVFSSGGPLNAESSDNVTRLWQRRPIEVFGSSETGGIAWRQSEDGSTSWQPLPGVEWEVVDDHLQVRSPHLANAEWFVTKDRAALRNDNKFELLGRSDRIIKLEERRISLTAIENSLQSSKWVLECRLVVLPGQRERLAAIAILNAAGKQLLEMQGKLPMVGKLRTELEASVDPIAIPRHWRFLDSMPVDSQGKTSQRMLAELFRMSLPTTKNLQRSVDSAQLELAISKELIVFDGHFSQHAAVVPGVALIDWAIKHARRLFTFDHRFLRIEALKFQQVIRPDCNIHLDLQWNAVKGILMFTYESQNGKHANGRIVFAIPDITGVA